MVRYSRNLIGWLDGYGFRGGVEGIFIFFFVRLIFGELLYFFIGMYRDFSVYRFCFYVGELIYFNVVFIVFE